MPTQDGQAQAQAQAQSQAQTAGEASMIESFKLLATEMSNVTNVLAAQGITQLCEKFNGNPKQFRDWSKSIEKFAKLANCDDKKTILLAFQMSTGAVSGYIQRYTESNPSHTWLQIKQALALRFSDVTDPYVAMTMLRKIKQNVGENVQQYTERLLSLAEEAFVGQSGPFVERQLIEMFVDGLCAEQLKLTILRRGPATLQDALNIAVTENNLRQRVGTSHKGPLVTKYRVDTDKGPEPMEIDHSRGIRCFKCKRMGHRSRDCRSVHVVENPQIRRVKCWGCSEEGHVVKNCPQRNRRENKGQPRGYGDNGKFRQENKGQPRGYGDSGRFRQEN